METRIVVCLDKGLTTSGKAYTGARECPDGRSEVTKYCIPPKTIITRCWVSVDINILTYSLALTLA